jgi:DNA-binding response OmpR family regulator
MGPYRWAMSKVELLAEDEAAISLALEDALTDAGFRVAGPFAYCARALEWLRDNTPDAALLDVELADGSCTEVARTLHQRGVPLVFFSGGAVYDVEIRTLVPDAHWFEKPADYREVMRALNGLAPRSD